MSDANDFLNERIGDTKEPQPLPEGDFDFLITSYSLGKRKNESETPYVRFLVKPTESYTPEVPTDSLNQYKKVEWEFPLTDAAKPIAKRVLTKQLSVESDDDTPWRQLFENALGVRFRAITKIELVGKNKDIKVTKIAKVVRNAEAA
jgi:hypothetical protein